MYTYPAHSTIQRSLVGSRTACVCCLTRRHSGKGMCSSGCGRPAPAPGKCPRYSTAPPRPGNVRRTCSRGSCPESADTERTPGKGRQLAVGDVPGNVSVACLRSKLCRIKTAHLLLSYYVTTNIVYCKKSRDKTHRRTRVVRGVELGECAKHKRPRAKTYLYDGAHLSSLQDQFVPQAISEAPSECVWPSYVS